MKQLVLVRHGKSSWKHNVSDKDRPLKKRGKDDALRVSKAFKTYGLVIDIVLSSPANRAFSTCKIFLETLDIKDAYLKIEEDLYDFSGNSVIDVVKSLDDSLNTVMIFGHNHAFTAIVNAYGDRYIDNLPTSGLVVIKFNIESWKYIRMGQTELVLFPRDFRP
jgi:phosphohistidine phosphatase